MNDKQIDQDLSESEDGFSISTALPDALLTRDQWVCWRSVQRGDALSKIPIDPKTGKAASVNDPTTWATFADADAKAKAEGWGIGFVLTDEDAIVGIDLDGCRNPETGEIVAKAQEIIEQFGSYTEVSPSGEGVHIFAEGEFPLVRPRTKKSWDNGRGIEVYDSNHYFTVTGKHVAFTPWRLVWAQHAIEWMGDTYLHWGDKEDSAEPHISDDRQFPALSDEEVLRKAMNAKNGPKFKRLLSGDTAAYGNDHSSADLALCRMLAYSTKNNRAQMDRLFRQSKLYRDKWERDDYRERTLELAIASNRDQAAR